MHNHLGNVVATQNEPANARVLLHGASEPVLCVPRQSVHLIQNYHCCPQKRLTKLAICSGREALQKPSRARFDDFDTNEDMRYALSTACSVPLKPLWPAISSCLYFAVSLITSCERNRKPLALNTDLKRSLVFYHLLRPVAKLPVSRVHFTKPRVGFPMARSRLGAQ